MSNENIFTVGGTVQASNGLYISRRADDELLAVCREGNFAYVLTPRQLGKSSLMVRTAEQLTKEGARSVIIDLSQIGVQVTPEEWYLGLLSMIEDQLDLETNAVHWWRDRAHLGVTQRLTQFFEEVLLKEVNAPVVVFVDEIDTTLSLGFTDDFFAAIRYFYNARALSQDVRRLSFVLIGVATPGDLIRDPQRTPFNIGQRVDLTDFTIEEAWPLAAGFGLGDHEARQVLGWVMKWTAGHPYLTQRICRVLTDGGRKSWSEADIDAMVSKTFLGKVSEEDNNLQFVRDMLTKRAPDLAAVLNTYRNVLKSKRPVHDEEQSLIKSHLKLSGVALRQHGELKVRNPIYAQVFNDAWVKQHLPVNWTKRLTRVAAGLVLTLMVLSIPTSIWAFAAQRRAVAQRDEANRQRTFAIAAQQEAMRQRDEANKLRTVAETQRAIAEKQTQVARVEREKAEKARVETEKQRQLALAAANQEKSARQGEAVQRRKAEGAAASAMDAAYRMEAAARAERLAKEEVEKQRQIAETQRKEAERLRTIAEEAATKEQVARNRAELSEKAAVQQRQIADDLRAKAVEQRDTAQGQNQIAVAQQLWKMGEQLLLAGDGPAAEVFLARSLVLDDRPEVRRTLVEAQTKRRQVAWERPSGNAAREISFTLSHNRKTLALTRAEGSILILDAKTGKEIRLLAEPLAPVKILYSADDSQLASQSADGTVDIWDLNTGELVIKLKPNINELISFNPSRKRLVRLAYESAPQGQGYSGVQIEILDYSGNKITRIQMNRAPIFEFSVDEKFLAIGHIDGTVDQYEMEQGLKVRSFVGERSPIVFLQFSRDGQRLASQSLRQVAVWDLTTGTLVKSFYEGAGFLSSLQFSPEGTKLAVMVGEEFRVWDLTLNNPISVDVSAQNMGAVRQILLGPLGKILCAQNSDGTIRIWDVASKELIGTFYSSGRIVGFSPDGASLYSETGQSIKVWDLSPVKAGKLLLGHARPVVNVRFSPDGKFLASSSEDSEIKIWDVQTGKEIAKYGDGGIVLSLHDFDPQRQRLGVLEKELTAKDSPNASAGVLSQAPPKVLIDSSSNPPDGERFQYKSWDLNSRKAVITPLPQFLEPGFLSPDGRVVFVYGGGGKPSKLRHLDTGKEVPIEFLSSSSGDFSTPRFSGDSRHLALMTYSGQVKVLNTETGAEVVIPAPKRLAQVLFTPDSRRLALIAVNSIELWDLGAKHVATRISGFIGSARSSSFSPDGRRLATVNGAGRILVWDLQSGSMMRLLKPPLGSTISSLTFSPDGTRLIANGNEPRLWNLELTSPGTGFLLPGQIKSEVQFSPDGLLAYGDGDHIRLLDFEELKRVVGADRWTLLEEVKSSFPKRLTGIDFDVLPQIRLRQILGLKDPSYEVVFADKEKDFVALQDLKDKQSETDEKNFARPPDYKGTVSGTISISGQAPAAMRIDTSADAVCGLNNPNLTTENWVVSNGKLANVFVYVKSDNRFDGRHFETPTSEVLIERKGCQTFPHVLGVQTNQVLAIFNNDDTTHNFHPLPQINQEWNQTAVAGSVIYKSFARPETFIPLKCNQHPWEKAYIGVFAHPFFAVSARDGAYTISGLPPGHYTLVAWHEGGVAGTEQTIDITIGANESKTVDFTFAAPVK